MRSLRRAAPVLALALVLAACTPSPGTGAAAARRGSPTGPSVTGFVLDGAREATVDAQAPYLSQIDPDGITLTQGGTQVSTPSDGAKRLLADAHAKGLRAELLVSNYSDRLGDFSPAAGSTLLRHRANRNRVVDRLAGFVRSQGWDGINVDLESLRYGDGDGLVAFVKRLQAAMPAAKTVSIDLMSATSVTEYRNSGYELAALAANLDVVAVMTYDQHGPTWSAPGPIGALGWQRQVLDALLTKVPAGKVDLGVAGYGYGWKHGRRGPGIEYGVADARLAAGDLATWDDRAGEWTATLPNGTVMWWSDNRSYRLRYELAVARNLHGLAVWRLGSIDSLSLAGG